MSAGRVAGGRLRVARAGISEKSLENQAVFWFSPYPEEGGLARSLPAGVARVA
jgi:hypothetical protein